MLAVYLYKYQFAIAYHLTDHFKNHSLLARLSLSLGSSLTYFLEGDRFSSFFALAPPFLRNMLSPLHSHFLGYILVVPSNPGKPSLG